ncbi:MULTISPECIES: hypothetical protein [unclassified Coleofasciculus]|uniref:hypothetical protein n=1 Tax=unclassified Coleofasciculus TaxID=2692782 RepID=UPI00187F63BD|nr:MULTISPECIES: hypothetical protein [unclassified Coleofasciculus]MBE9127666.1 hypothetical protein [Coleofasciculus sp. LEGE 07081]MBE9151004.1 hypothetical protein [Coleofasciculus sp. LEGE 07092]
MRQAPLIGLITLLALFFGGCQGGNEGEEVSEVPSSPTPAASPANPTASPQATAFANPDVSPQPNPPAAADLVQTLPPEVRFKQAPKGRSDPFAVIPVQPEVTVSPNPQAGGNTRPVPKVSQLPPLSKPNAGGSQGGATGGRATGGGTKTPQAGRTNVVPQKKPSSPSGSNRPSGGSTSGGGSAAAKPNTGSSPSGGVAVPPPPEFIPELPKLPEPELAQQIEIKGVVQVGNVPRAIIKEPNEPSRYVQAGQRLSNGQVLVKRIEVNRGPTPVVVLEQYGIEIARRVGEQPAGTAGQPASPTAFRIAPPPLKTTT